MDVNEDGKIDLDDYYDLAQLYGTSGESINKTALLLELLLRVQELEKKVLELENTIAELDKIKQIVSTLSSSLDFTPTSPSHRVVIIAKGNNIVETVVETENHDDVELKDNGNRIDHVLVDLEGVPGFTYCPFSLMWEGTLSAGAHTISVTSKWGISVSNVRILIIEFTL